MECVPAVKLEVENVATPELSVPVPSVVAPSLNVTEPVGVPELPDTVAVKIIELPTLDGFSDEVSAVLEDCVPVAAVPFTVKLSTRPVPAVPTVVPLLMGVVEVSTSLM